MQQATTFGAFLVAMLATSGELVSAMPSQMNVVSPRGQRHGGGSFEVRVKPRSATTYKHPALAIAKAVYKFNKTMPAHIDAIVQKFSTASVAARGTESGSATTTPEAEDEAYITNIAVGTPAQTLPMDFDTGSSDLWVFSTETSSSEVNGQKTYDPSSSSSAKKLSGYSWSISYGDGSTSKGNVYQDTVTIGNITVTGQAVESATEVSSSFTSDSSSSGLVGLAMSSLNTVSPTAQKTFFDNAKSQLASAVFSADLQHDAPGTYTFGAIDSSKFTGTMYYANLYNSTESLSGYWTFQSSGYQVGDGTSTTSSSTSSTSSSSTNPFDAIASAGFGSGSDSGNPFSSDSGSSGFGNSNDESSGYGFAGFGKWVRSLLGRKTEQPAARAVEEAEVEPRSTRQHSPVTNGASINAKRASTTITGIADTGTTLLMLDDSIVSDYYSQVSGAEDSEEEGGYVFSCDATLPDFSFNVGSGNITVPGSYINWAAVDTTNTTCYGGLQSDSSIGFSIFGDIALKAAYVVFDGAEGRVGWAAKTTS